jgi:hypothetical protein
MELTLPCRVQELKHVFSLRAACIQVRVLSSVETCQGIFYNGLKALSTLLGLINYDLRPCKSISSSSSGGQAR